MGQGVPVLLLHSAMSSKLQWYRLMRLLSGKYQAVAVDFYGYGQSPFPTNQKTFCFDDEIRLIESLLQDVIRPGEPFHLVGHSYGGSVALKFAYEFPGRVLSLSLFEPVAFHLLPENDEVWPEVRHRYERVQEYIDKGENLAAAEFFIDYWNGAGTFAAYPVEAGGMFSRYARKLGLGYRALIGEPLTLEHYRKIKAPVYLMVGNDSPHSSRRVAELLVDYLPNCRFDRVEGGHMTPVSHPGRVNPLIESFIRSVG